MSGSLDLAHAKQVVPAVEKFEEGLSRCRFIDIDLVHLERIDGTRACWPDSLTDLMRRGSRHGLSITRIPGLHD